MTTVGYGDFYPKTQVGRFITIIACIVGVYFVSMMMVFMTQKSMLNTNEFKAFKLLTRLKRRKEIANYRALMIHQALLMYKYKLKYNEDQENIEYKKKYYEEKRNIITGIEEVKQELKIIKSFDIIPTQEHLFDISERIKTNISEIKHHLESLAFVNEILLNYTDSQIEIAKYLKNNCYATKLLYNTIEKKRLFGKLNNVDLKLKDLFEHEVEKSDEQNKYADSTKVTLNPQDPSFIKNENHEDNILAHNVHMDDIRAHFDFIFTKEKQGQNSATNSRTVSRKETAKTLQLLEFHKQNNDKIRKYTTNKLLNSSASITSKN